MSDDSSSSSQTVNDTTKSFDKQIEEFASFSQTESDVKAILIDAKKFA